MKKLSKTIFAIIAAVGFFINPALPRAWAYEPVLVYNPAGQPVFQYNYFAEGEYYDPDDAGSGDPDEYAYRAFSAAEKNALQRAGQYWVDILSPRKAPVETVIFNIMPDIEPGNAAAGVLQWFDLGDGTTRFVTPPEAVLAFGRPVRSELDAYFHAFMKIGVNRYNFDLNGQQNVMPWNLETLMIHEIGHALGINDNDNDDDDDPDTLPAQPSLFETQMNDDNPDDPGRWYFYGPKAMNVYGDGHNRPLPMEDSDHEQEKSHFGLRNTLMTHRFFRNYATFVEAELAALIDIGYEIDLRDHFGRSVYTEDNFIANNQGFFARNEAGTAYLEGQPNLTPYGLGLHVFGDGNTVYQNADILADGPGGGGIRSDGVENTIIVNPGVKVTANGARGSGLLVAYGHDSTVVNRGTIQATGPDGDAVRFDIGVNFFDYEDFDKNGYGSFAQYSYFDFASSSSFCGDPDNDGLCAEFENATDDLDGPLVASFDVTGSITGSRSAIYIGGNSHVGEINILNGASIQGRIINDYYYSGEDDQVPSKSTYLNFGLAADADGQAITGTPDPNFRFTIKDDILGYGADNTELGYEYRYTGRGLFDVALAGGQTIVSSQATIKVNNFTVASEAALLGQA
ncbi:MAG: hypothetical protein LBP55_05205, partial [Candidatus Adiutrix sp.]|nr:hypothetical protein [Candidatus Adiutrix sp.]